MNAGEGATRSADEHGGAASDAPETCDVAVVGAGPAGMAAAAAAAERGLATVVVDEQGAVGGQIYRAIQRNEGRSGAFRDLLGPDYAKGGDLARRLERSGARLLTGHSVFDISPEGGLGVLGPDGARWLEARRIVIAAGAMERPVPVPGWTLPGVMGAGAAQTLLKSAGLVPDAPTVIAGSGPLLYLVALQLLAAGARIAAVLDTTPRENIRKAAPLLARAFLSGGEIRKGIAWRRRLMKTAPKFHAHVSDIRIEGSEHVEAVSFRSGAGRETIAATYVLLHEGVVPGTHLAMAAGAEHAYDPLSANWRARTDGHGRSSLEHILIAGDCGAIGGAEVAAAQGELAGLAAAHDLARIDAARLRDLSSRAAELIERKAPLRRFLDTLYRPRAEVLVPPESATVVCRCEEVTAGELRRIAKLGCTGPNQAKAFSRCGMGPCQGRMCGLVVSHVLAAAQGRSVAETGQLRVRPPVKPITVAELAGIAGLGAPPGGAPLLPTTPNVEEAK